MKFSELNLKTVSELYTLLHNNKKELLSFRIQKHLGQLASTASIQSNKKVVAQIMTRLNQLKKNGVK